MKYELSGSDLWCVSIAGVKHEQDVWLSPNLGGATRIQWPGQPGMLNLTRASRL